MDGRLNACLCANLYVYVRIRDRQRRERERDLTACRSAITRTDKGNAHRSVNTKFAKRPIPYSSSSGFHRLRSILSDRLIVRASNRSGERLRACNLETISVRPATKEPLSTCSPRLTDRRHRFAERLPPASSSPLNSISRNHVAVREAHAGIREHQPPWWNWYSVNERPSLVRSSRCTPRWLIEGDDAIFA